MEKITWTPKIRQALIEKLYQNDALGAVDPALVEDVGFRLVHRCRSIALVTRRAVECPRCGAEMPTCEPGSFKLLSGALRCPTPGCEQVVAFLDGLFARQGGVDKERWRSQTEQMFDRRKGR